MLKRLVWIVIIAAAAGGGCLSGSGAIRGASAANTGAHGSSPTALAQVSSPTMSR
jgi:hypothetical protein